MRTLSNLLVALVAAAHFYFLVLETFLWTTPVGLRTFGMTQEVADSSAVLAANQGVYNGFLAAGLLWGLGARQRGLAIKTFFLACIIVAGVVGTFTANASILFMQALPAALALACVWMAPDGASRPDRVATRAQ